VDDVTCCRYFPTTSEEITQKWFNGLPTGSITSFVQLAELLNAHFIVSKRERRNHITSCQDLKKQRRRLEGLYVEVQSRGCPNPYSPRWDDLYNLPSGLLLGRFKFSHVKSKITTLVKRLRKSEDFIQDTEMYTGDDSTQHNGRK